MAQFFQVLCPEYVVSEETGSYIFILGYGNVRVFSACMFTDNVLSAKFGRKCITDPGKGVIDGRSHHASARN